MTVTLYESQLTGLRYPGFKPMIKAEPEISTVGGLPYMRVETLPVLAVKQPWASLIMDRKKTIEVRTRPTKKRGTVAIYASRTTPRKSEAALFWDQDSKYKEHGKYLPYGRIIATAELIECVPVKDYFHFNDTEDKHKNPMSYYQDGLYFWILEDIQPTKQIEFKMNGSVIWGSIDAELLGVV